MPSRRYDWVESLNRLPTIVTAGEAGPFSETCPQHGGSSATSTTTPLIVVSNRLGNGEPTRARQHPANGRRIVVARPRTSGIAAAESVGKIGRRVALHGYPDFGPPTLPVHTRSLQLNVVVAAVRPSGQITLQRWLARCPACPLRSPFGWSSPNARGTGLLGDLSLSPRVADAWTRMAGLSEFKISTRTSCPERDTIPVLLVSAFLRREKAFAHPLEVIAVMRSVTLRSAADVQVVGTDGVLHHLQDDVVGQASRP